MAAQQYAFQNQQVVLQLTGWRIRTVSVIDTLSAGFDRVTKRPWLVLVPVLLKITIN